MQPILSIIIPIYNAEKYIEECLRSIIDQDVSDDCYEIICIDDGSKDNSREIVDAYSKQYKNLILFHQENSGVSTARNVGLNLAHGKYVWFVDADDYIFKDAIKQLLDLVSDSDGYQRIAFGFCVASFSYDEYLSNPLLKEQLTSRCSDGSVCCSVYEKRFLIENDLLFRKDIAAGEDNLFNYEFSKTKGKQKKIDNALYLYRINEVSVTHLKTNRERILEAHLKCAKVVKRYYDNEARKEIRTIRYLHCELECVMIIISELTYQKRKEYLQCILTDKLFPFTGIKPKIINIYTNIYSSHLRTVCVLSSTPIFSWKIKLWATAWNSKTKKNVEKKLKNLSQQKIKMFN